MEGVKALLQSAPDSTCVLSARSLALLQNKRACDLCIELDGEKAMSHLFTCTCVRISMHRVYMQRTKMGETNPVLLCLLHLPGLLCLRCLNIKWKEKGANTKGVQRRISAQMCPYSTPCVSMYKTYVLLNSCISGVFKDDAT